MGTRSMIGVKNSDGTVNAVYCHWDGYLVGGVGQVLLENFTSSELVNNLIQQGSRSSLSADYIQEEQSVIYNYDSVDDYLESLDSEIEYAYLFDNGWKVSSIHFPVIRELYNDERKYRFFSDYYNHQIEYSDEKKIIKSSIYGEYRRKLYDIKNMLAYELKHMIVFHSSNNNYNKFLENDLEFLNEYLEKGYFTKEYYDNVLSLDNVDRSEGIKRIKEITEPMLKAIAQKELDASNRIYALTKFYDIKETAKKVKAELTKRLKHKFIVRSDSHYESVDISSKEVLTKSEVEQINAIIKEFEDKNDKFYDAYDNKYTYDGGNLEKFTGKISLVTWKCTIV